MHTDRNLLFGILAVQLRRISPTQLVDAAGAWATDPSRDLSQRLLEAGALSQRDQKLIDEMVDVAIKEHGGDAAATLASFGGDDQIRLSFGGTIVRAGQGEVRTIPAPTVRLEAIRDEYEEAMPAVPEVPGRYSQVGEYAHGGMGRILLAHDRHLGRDIALKELLPASEFNKSGGEASPVRQSVPLVARFLQEARITGQLEHPSIVPVYELGHRADGTLYYTMKLVRGKTLAQIVRQPLTLRERLALLPHFEGLCQAIAYAHSRGVINRDIKPSNVMIGEFGETVVIDWGLAKVRGRQDIHRAGFEETLRTISRGEMLRPAETAYGQAIGTPAYMSPEQAGGQLDLVDERSDVYALGAVLYELLTGRLPFPGNGVAETLQMILSGKHESVVALAPEVPPELAAICERALELAPGRRYRSARELAEEIQRFLSGALVQAYTYRFSDHLRRWLRQHRSPVIATLAALVLAGAAAIASYAQVVQARNEERAQRQLAEDTNRRLVWENYVALLGNVQKQLDEGNYARAQELAFTCPIEHRGWEWGRLLRETSPELLSLSSDIAPGMIGGSLYKATFSSDGRYILVDRPGYLIKDLFDLEQARFVAAVQTYGGWRECTGFMPNGRDITVSTGDHRVVVMNPFTKETLARFDSGEGELHTIAVSNDASLVAGYNINRETGRREVILWNASDGAVLKRLPMDSLPPGAYPQLGGSIAWWHERFLQPRGQVLSFLNGNAQLIFADEQLGVLDTVTGQRKFLAPSDNWIAAYAQKSDTALVVSPTHQLELWQVTKGKRIAVSEQTVGDEGRVSLSPDGRLVALSGEDATWSQFDGTNLQLLERHRGHTEGIHYITFSSNGSCVATTDLHEVKVWPSLGNRDREFRQFTDEHGTAMPSVDPRRLTPGAEAVYAFDHKTQCLAMDDGRGTLSLWAIPSCQRLLTWHAHQGMVWAIVFSPDDETLATAGADGSVHLWRRHSGELVHTFQLPKGMEALSLAFSPDGHRLVVGEGLTDVDQPVAWRTQLLDVVTGRELGSLPHKQGAVYDVWFSPNGSLIFAGVNFKGGAHTRSNVNFVQVYDAQTGQELSNSGFDPGGLSGVYRGTGSNVGMTSDSRFLLTLNTLWDLTERRKVWEQGHLNAICVAIHPGGRCFVMVNTSGTASIHALRDGRELIELGRLSAPLAFTPDGRDLYAFCQAKPDGTGEGLQVLHAQDWRIPDRNALFKKGCGETLALLRHPVP